MGEGLDHVCSGRLRKSRNSSRLAILLHLGLVGIPESWRMTAAGSNPAIAPVPGVYQHGRAVNQAELMDVGQSLIAGNSAGEAAGGGEDEQAAVEAATGVVKRLGLGSRVGEA